MQACILRSAFRVVTEYRSVPGAKRMVYPQVRQSGCLKRPALRRMPQLEAREFIHVYFTMVQLIEQITIIYNKFYHRGAYE